MAEQVTATEFKGHLLKNKFDEKIRNHLLFLKTIDENGTFHYDEKRYAFKK